MYTYTYIMYVYPHVLMKYHEICTYVIFHQPQICWEVRTRELLYIYHHVRICVRTYVHYVFIRACAHAIYTHVILSTSDLLGCTNENASDYIIINVYVYIYMYILYMHVHVLLKYIRCDNIRMLSHTYIQEVMTYVYIS